MCECHYSYFYDSVFHYKASNDVQAMFDRVSYVGTAQILFCTVLYISCVVLSNLSMVHLHLLVGIFTVRCLSTPLRPHGRSGSVAFPHR